MEYVHALACALVLTAIVTAEARRLNEWVTHFEPLLYEPLRIHRQHVRLRRSLQQQQQQQQRQQQQSAIFLRFWAFDKNFILRIRPDSSSFHEDFTLETETLGKVRPELGHIYSGQLVGTFYMERSRKLFDRRTEPPFHSLMYSRDDVTIPAVCGLVEDVRTWMDMQAPERTAAEQRSDRATMRRLLSSTGEQPNTTRARGGRDRRVCNLEVNVDHLLHARFLDDARGEGGRARERITALVAQHVARASDVFRAADFAGVEDISFIVQRIRINDSHSCATGKTAHGNPFCAPAADIGYLLHLTSLSNHDEFCLSYTWTYRDFYGGVLGLAWVANAERNYGGVCEKARPSAVSVAGSTEVLRLSTNVGVLTFVNYNSFVATVVSEMVFCHELGHSFGADHDAPPGRSCYGTCAPCGEEGNYIMFPSPSQGKKPNNYKFSQCSRNSIGRVLAPMVAGESARENCLQVSGESAACTPGRAKAETTPCAGGTRVCAQGECSHSVCLKYGLRECSLAGDRYSAQQLCLLACQDEFGSCKPGCDLASPSARAALCGLRLPPGSPCNEQLGYCDVFQRCRPVDDEGPLTRIQRLFFGTPVNAIRLFIVDSPLPENSAAQEERGKTAQMAVLEKWAAGNVRGISQLPKSLGRSAGMNGRPEQLAARNSIRSEHARVRAKARVGGPSAERARWRCLRNRRSGQPGTYEASANCQIHWKTGARPQQGGPGTAGHMSDPPRAVLVLSVSCWLLALAFRCCAALTPTDNPHKSRRQHIMQRSAWDSLPR
ncbi:disintegrin and metalloproteinase domain-containing protein 10-like [Rhipicephalus sanguineus]|uniref:disintegrin and metalloproteinase domain-containing protein 10-like n=1 Tax=Rhipicephalus sanguineus TaxID=34632 RepID=UPI0020C4254C|nr:disintegrin and metalloproteinase domain-containing protein 10-like [Rhipicephalus sanguineus]